MEHLSRKAERAALRSRLEPLLASTLSNNEVARRAQTSATTVARIRRQRGIAMGVVEGADGKEYAVGGAEAKVILQIRRHLNAVSSLMVPEVMTEEVASLVDELQQKLQRVKA